MTTHIDTPTDTPTATPADTLGATSAAASTAPRDYPEMFHSDIVYADELEDATARQTVHKVSDAMRAELARLIIKLRADHPEVADLAENVGIASVQHLEKAVANLETVAWLTMPVDEPVPLVPAADNKPKRWALFELIGARRNKIKEFSPEQAGDARREAAERNGTAFGLSYLAEPIDDEAPAQ